MSNARKKSTTPPPGVAGPAGEVSLHAEIELLRKNNQTLVDTLRLISMAQPDRLDHSIDVSIIERASRFAKQALAEVAPDTTANSFTGT